MGALWNALVTAFGFNKVKLVNLVFIGLDNAGKSSIIRTIQGLPKQDMVPTIGVGLEEFQRGRFAFRAFDMSGQGNNRELWHHYFSDVHAIVVVIDTTDRDRFSILKHELELVLRDPVLQRRKIPICFMANKMDLPGLTPTQCTLALGLETIKDRNWSMFHTSAVSGVGLEDAINWLSAEIIAK
ncbi:ADP-ribosylation factor family-domain-containing protein [Gorgonomyces haynaldii]|nr:ADP-ribosylation factor family-domain-containing protein [Gorgonomyces haynaldii]